MQTAYTLEQLTQIDCNNVPQEIKNDIRGKIQQIILDVIDIKRIHNQGSWQSSNQDIIDAIIEGYKTIDPTLKVEELHHCETAACIAGHVELDLLQLCNVTNGKYMADDSDDTLWFEYNKETNTYESTYETYNGVHSPLVEQFYTNNKDEYRMFSDGKPAFLIAKLAGLSELEASNIFDGDLTIANIAFNWNAICRKNGWDGIFANYLIPTGYLIRACKKSYVCSEKEDIIEIMDSSLVEHHGTYPEIFDHEGYFPAKHIA